MRKGTVHSDRMEDWFQFQSWNYSQGSGQRDMLIWGGKGLWGLGSALQGSCGFIRLSWGKRDLCKTLSTTRYYTHSILCLISTERETVKGMVHNNKYNIVHYAYYICFTDQSVVTLEKILIRSLNIGVGMLNRIHFHDKSCLKVIKTSTVL